jgi:hypothetical protein
MNYDKPFKTLDEQLNILRARGLEIYDEDKGKEYAHAMDIPCDISERLPKLEVSPNYKL